MISILRKSKENSDGNSSDESSGSSTDDGVISDNLKLVSTENKMTEEAQTKVSTAAEPNGGGKEKDGSELQHNEEKEEINKKINSIEKPPFRITIPKADDLTSLLSVNLRVNLEFNAFSFILCFAY